MTHKPTPADVDEFLDTTLLDDDPVLSAALKDSDAAGLPKIAVSAQQGKFLSLLATAVGARRILEIGTLGGFSTIWLARGAGPDVGSPLTPLPVPTGGPCDLPFIDTDKENNPSYLEWAVKPSPPGSVIVVDNV